jgi:predicted DNA binding CopG/RHH family protein
MSKSVTYTEGPIGDVKVIRDFLPPPAELAFREEQVKVTIGLSKSSVDFFKRAAREHRTQYQKMIRRLLDLYAAQHQ